MENINVMKKKGIRARNGKADSDGKREGIRTQ